MPRPTRSTPTTKRSVTLPNDLWDFIDKIDWDPVRDKPRYGGQAKILERLVREERKRIQAVNDLSKELSKEPSNA